MRRLALVLLAAVVVSPGSPPSPPAPAPTAFSFVQVVEKECTLTLSRPSVRAGSVSIELVNFGMDTHDLVVKSDEGRREADQVQAARPTRPDRADAAADARAATRSGARCPDHKARGMRATLVVTK